MIPASETRFLRLLGTSLTGGKPQQESNPPPSPEEWHLYYKMSVEHAVQGILYESIELLPPASRPDYDMLFRLYADVVNIENANIRQDEVIADLFPAYAALGASCYLVKGQAVSRCYPKPRRRSPGDIDIYVRNHFDEVHRWAKDNGTGIGNLDYRLGHHVHFRYRGVDVENHFLLLRMYRPAFNRIFRERLDETLGKAPASVVRIGGKDIPVLPAEFHLVYLISHLVRHMFGVGVGLRQLLDVLMFVSSQSESLDGKFLTDTFRDLKLNRITDAIATIAVRDLGMDEKSIPFTWSRKDRYADLLLRLIFKSGNFGRKQVQMSQSIRQQSLQRAKMMFRNAFTLCQLYPEELLAALYMKGVHLASSPCRRFTTTCKAAG